MVRLSPISGRKLIRILTQLGFVEVRRKGSHRFFIHPEEKSTTVVPEHGSEDIGLGLLRKILRDIEMDVDEFDSLRRQ